MAAGHAPEATTPPDVSVVVSTYARAGLLPRLLAALERQTLDRGRFEVVIADDGSPDDTPKVLDDLAARTPIDLVVVRAQRNRGPAAGRNLAAARARGRVLAFTDDDCVPDPGWLERGLAAMGGGPTIVVGCTEPAPDQPRGPFSRTMHVTDARYLATCNVFYRREDFAESGGFDERFRRAAGEDTDLGLRLQERGAEVRYEPGALVHHDVSPSSLRAALRRAASWADIPLLVRRHPSYRRTHLPHPLFWKQSHPRLLLGLLGLALARRWPAALLLLAPWVRFRYAVDPITPGPRRRVATLPGAFAVDAVEVATMVRGSVRHRTLLL
jgi:GT2 family glycosyltransferase